MKKVKKVQYQHFKPWLLLVTAQALIWLLNIGGCSTSEMYPPQPPIPPSYTKVPHPKGRDLSDLSAIFIDPTAPKDKDFSKKCDSDYIKLTERTQSKEELKTGVEELVMQDPVNYHWCFYAKLLELENFLMKDSYLDERQKKVLTTYEFLVPVARGFVSEFHDSRYLYWAMNRYKRLSEWVFFRKLDLTPEGTSELVHATDPFALWRKDSQEGVSILDKYNLAKGPPQLDMKPDEPIQRDVASQEPTPVEGTPVAAAQPSSAFSPVPSPQPVTPSPAPTEVGTIDSLPPVVDFSGAEPLPEPSKTP